MCDIRNGVEKLFSNSMSTIRTNHTAFVLFGLAFNNRSEVPVERAGSDKVHGEGQAFKRRLDNSTTVGVHVSHAKRLIQVSVIPSSIVGSDIQVNNVCRERERKKE
jgi:hypothetical protein